MNKVNFNEFKCEGLSQDLNREYGFNFSNINKLKEIESNKKLNNELSEYLIKEMENWLISEYNNNIDGELKNWLCLLIDNIDFSDENKGNELLEKYNCDIEYLSDYISLNELKEIYNLECWIDYWMDISRDNINEGNLDELRIITTTESKLHQILNC